MATPSVLILSHCGFSFAEDLMAAVSSRGLQPLILSSRPLPEHGEHRLEKLRELASAVRSTQTHQLTLEDVEHAIGSLRADGYEIRACISVWEGYRVLMSAANLRLGVSDLPAHSVAFLRDKLSVRNELHRAGLSRITAHTLTPARLLDLQRDGGRYFIKPVSGIASYGAFRLSPDTTWKTIESIIKSANEDQLYRSILGEDLQFMAEDYLGGVEFSFEVLVSGGQIHVVGIHEKCELTETNGTVLEDSCTSPPVSVTSRDVSAALAWLSAVFACLQLDWGCFHVEARFDGTRWDLIEINPRVGGSLISHSVKALNGEASLLDLWLALLLDQEGGVQSPALLATLHRLAYDANGTPPTSMATFFRAYFAAAGEIDHIEIRTGQHRPIMEQIMLKAGDSVPDTPRETFLGQILWQMPRAERDAALNDLLKESASAVCVRYRTPAPVLEDQS